MECDIPGPNVKIFAKAILALSKIGDELYVQPQEDSISFRTVNLANSAYADFAFQENYFSNYSCRDAENTDILTCKISMRSAISVFKTPNVIEKQIERCHIKLNNEYDELLFILKHKNGVTKTYLVPIIDSEKLEVKYKKDKALNQLLCQARVLLDANQNFHPNLLEITLEVSMQKMLLRNYSDEASGASHITRTQLELANAEFSRYIIGEETTVTFCMKELRAILAFAETVGLAVQIFFETAGRPIIFTLRDTAFEVNMVLATVNPNTATQTESSILEKREKQKKVKSINRRKKGYVSGISCVNSKVLSKKEDLQKNAGLSIHIDRDQGTSNRSRASNQSPIISSRYPLKTVPNSFATEDGNSSIRNRNNHNTADDVPLHASSGINHTLQSKNQTMLNRTDPDVICASPPRSRKRPAIFKKCFEKTFDPRSMPGHNVILAQDSDEDSDF